MLLETKKGNTSNKNIVDIRHFSLLGFFSIPPNYFQSYLNSKVHHYF